MNRFYTCYLGKFVLLGLVNLVTFITLYAQPSDLIFSEYVEGSGNNKALEIYNGTSSTINLSTYVLQLYSNGVSTPTASLTLFGSLAAGKVFVLGRTDADRAIIAVMDVGSSNLVAFDGNDALVLRKGGANGAVIDAIGQIGTNPGNAGWGNASISTVDKTLRRRKDICKGDADANNTFDPASEWEVFASNTFDGLGKHAVICGQLDQGPQVLSTQPLNKANGVAANVNIAIKFNEMVSLSANALSLIGSRSGKHAFTLSRLATNDTTDTFILDPQTDFLAGEIVQVSILASGVQDQDANDPPDNLVADYHFGFSISSSTVCNTAATWISEVQGSAATSPLEGQTVDVEAIVTADFQEQEDGSLLGFFIQEELFDYDDNERSSEGLFVYNNGFGPRINIGDRVRIRAQVAERDGATILTQVRDLKVCATKQDLPPAALIQLPQDSSTALEAVEGMRVSFPQKLTIVFNHELGETGELSLSSSGLQLQYTELNLPSVKNFVAYQQQKFNERIILDDRYTNTYRIPVYHLQVNKGNMLRLGNSVEGLSGILEFSSGNYRIRPLAPVAFTNDNPRPAAPRPAGDLKIATFNLLNFFNGDGAGGGFPTARGARTLTAFRLQTRKILQAIIQLDADILGLQELENDGGGNRSAAQELVDSLNALRGSGTYALSGPGVRYGADQIVVGIIYKTAKVRPDGGPVFLNSSNGIFLQNRLPLAQTFIDQRGEKFTLIVNHLRSKLGDGTGLNADILDGQSAYNQVRTDAIQEILTWVQGDPTRSGDPDFVMVGDYNAYEQEDPLRLLEASGYVNVVPAGQSKDFDGFLGDLDHIFASPTMARQFLQGAKWNINSVESLSRFQYDAADMLPGTTEDPIGDPFRCSDHDPVVAGFTLGFTKSMINGVVNKRNGEPLAGVNVALSGAAQAQNTSIIDGNFTFSNLNDGTYTVTPALDVQASEGVSTRDIIALQKHILGIKPIQNPYQLLAADVDNSGSITALDLVLMRRLILGLDTRFKAVPSWRFVEAGYVFKNPGSPWKEAYATSVRLSNLAGRAKVRFVGVKMGDVE